MIDSERRKCKKEKIVSRKLCQTNRIEQKQRKQANLSVPKGTGRYVCVCVHKVPKRNTNEENIGS